jgi:hypothetical protein
MYRRPFRACLSLLLVFALLSMVGPRAAMATPTGMVGMAHQMRALRSNMQVMTDMSSQHAAFHPGQHGDQDQCGCGAHCCLCGVCHATVSSGTVSGLSGTFAVPNGPRLLNLAQLALPLDPRPPRA